MLYKKFSLENFKGIDKSEIDLENNRIVTLVGLNESGKTTIMEGISLFFRMIRKDDLEETELNQFRPKGIDFTGDIKIEGRLVFEGEDKKKIEEFWKKLGKRKKLDLGDNFDFNFNFNFKLHKYNETKRVCNFDVKTENSKRGLYKTDKEGWGKLIEFIKENLIPEILYYDDFIFQIPAKIFFLREGIEEDDEIKNKDNKIWQSVIDDILKSVHLDMNFQEHVVDIWEEDEDAASNRLAQMEKVLNDKITSRWRELFGEENINFKEIKLEPRYSNGKLNISFKIRTENGTEFLVNERSKGFKWFFSFLLFTEFRKKRTKNILFLLDEPASNLHSSAQVKILEALEELSKDSLVIYSTHSHHLIKIEWLPGTYICINEKLSEEVLSGNLNISEGAKIDLIKYFSYVGQGLGNDNVSYFQPILDKLDYRPSSVEPIPDIVILEGKNDWYTLKYFNEIIFKNKFDLNLYSGGGANKLWEIIRIYLSWGRNFVVLLDGDKAGKRAKKDYINEFDQFIENKIFTLEDISGVQEDMEGLIGEGDKKRIYDSIYGKGTFDKIKSDSKKLKRNLNYAINQLLLQKKEIKINKPTKEKFNKLLSFIKKTISQQD